MTNCQTSLCRHYTVESQNLVWAIVWRNHIWREQAVEVVNFSARLQGELTRSSRINEWLKSTKPWLNWQVLHLKSISTSNPREPCRVRTTGAIGGSDTSCSKPFPYKSSRKDKHVRVRENMSASSKLEWDFNQTWILLYVTLQRQPRLVAKFKRQNCRRDCSGRRQRSFHTQISCSLSLPWGESTTTSVTTSMVCSLCLPRCFSAVILLQGTVTKPQASWSIGISDLYVMCPKCRY